MWPKGLFRECELGECAITRNGINVHFQGLISFLCLRFRTILLFLVALSNYFSNFRAERTLCKARFFYCGTLVRVENELQRVLTVSARD